MYEKDGQRYFIVDSHIHFWDGTPANQANRYGEGFINCFYDYHRNLSPESEVWPIEEFWQQSEERVLHDLFEVGYVDKGDLPADLPDRLLRQRLQHHRAGRCARGEVPGEVHRQRRVGPARR